MHNAYPFIIGLFILSGLISAAWGWRLIARARKTLFWPATEGTITRSEASAEDDDLLPRIEYSFTVHGKAYQQALTFPTGTSPSQQLTSVYLEKFPLHKKVMVSYHPQDPQQSTLEPGPVSGDWLVFAFGVGAVALGLVMLVFGW